MTTDLPPIPPRIQVLRKHVLILYRVWWALHYAIGLGGVMAGVLAGAHSANPQTNGTFQPYAWLFGAVGAICTSLVTFLGPIQKAERYWKAYHALDQSCLEYEAKEISIDKLIREARKVRSMITNGPNVADFHTNELHQLKKADNQSDLAS